ncbi:hypothetical protein [Microbispora hainanensis]|uniref:Uncharacterized protein n=1 Tax=Microbispora hainanensis TaxID=568844 RepID=A0A544YT42_9ACTN|nr:hypothetical protein [Microbispora hainanensis]TQS19928.1 hypothetical protein FLX08_17965 [Microbispora hainanensis]
MIGPFVTESVLAYGYAAALLVTAAGLDRLARRVAGRSERRRRPGRTPSHDGREIVRAPRPWPHSEAGRFHRGLALVLVVLAASLTLVEAVRHPAWPDLALAAAVLAAAAVTGRWLTGHLRAAPAGFPEPGQRTANRDR